MKLKKNRIFPLILVTFALMALIFIGGLIYLMNMVIYVNEMRNRNYDELSSNLANIVEQNMKSTCKSFTSYASLLSSYSSLDAKTVKPFLTTINEREHFDGVGIAFPDGKGFDFLGSAIDVGNREYFRKALKGEVLVSNQLIDYYTSKPIIVYAVPIMKDGKCKAVLIGKSSAKIQLELLGKDLLNNKERLVILDSKKHVITYSQTEDFYFNYDNIFKNGYLYKPLESLSTNPNKFLSMNEAEFQNRLDAYTSLLTNEGRYIWYSKPIAINDWTVLIGRVDVLDTETMQILHITIQLWFIISIVAFILLVVMILLQGRSNKKLSKFAYTDQITGAANWNRFEHQASRLLRKRNAPNYAMVVFDIDKFKVINDLYGHQNGDILLKQISNELKNWVVGGELYTRYMADNFDILLIYKTKDELAERMDRLFERIAKTSNVKHLKFSIGVYVITDTSLSIQRLSDFATIAQDSIKDSPEIKIAFFEEEERNRLLSEKAIENEMEEAIKNREFHVYLQPKFHVSTNEISGAEALVRWISPTRGFISPGEFIPTFEKNGFIIQLDHYMVEAVCQLQSGWLQKGYPLIPISVNISRLHFSVPTIVSDICKIVDQYQVPHEYIELELTESAFFDNKNALLTAVNQFREKGFLVSMDDFGSGFSSLNALKDLPLDVVKLDREFFTESTHTERGKAIVRDTIHMAKNLEMSVVAEGIETENQVAFLKQTACDAIQGFYFSKPLSIKDFEALNYKETE